MTGPTEFEEVTFSQRFDPVRLGALWSVAGVAQVRTKLPFLIGPITMTGNGAVETTLVRAGMLE